MATNKVLIAEQDGTPKQICFRDVTDFAPATNNDLRDASSPTLVQLDLTSVASAAYRQSDKFDFGAVRAEAYSVRAALEFAATPTAGVTCELWMAWSNSSTAARGNAGGVAGADAAYTGYSSNGDASVKQLDLIGIVVTTAQATGTVQIMEGGLFVPKARYGTLVFKNVSGAAMHSDAVEMNIVFDPVVDQIQAGV